MATFQPNARQSYSVQSPSPYGLTILIGMASVQVVPIDQKRRGIIFSNPGSEIITLLPGAGPAVAGQGMLLLPGATLPFLGDGRLLNYNCAWNAVAANGVSNPLSIVNITSRIGIDLILAPGWSIEG